MGAFEVVRSTTVNAPRARVHALVNDFHEWTAWSPWEDVDPAMQREYSGAGSGVGAGYSWRGNRKAGAGRMEITSSTPEGIGIALSFLKPVKAQNRIEFDLADAVGATTVTWRMTGEQTGLSALFGKLVPMDKVVGKDFEKGLRQLKHVAETQ
jgi:Polyketide cyclase / dehydrase and lipid transport